MCFVFSFPTSKNPKAKMPIRPMSIKRMMMDFPKLLKFSEKLKISPLPTETPTVQKAETTSKSVFIKGVCWVSTKRRVAKMVINEATIIMAEARLMISGVMVRLKAWGAWLLSFIVCSVAMISTATVVILMPPAVLPTYSAFPDPNRLPVYSHYTVPHSSSDSCRRWSQ